jgi:hypothetical protein
MIAEDKPETHAGLSSAGPEVRLKKEYFGLMPVALGNDS